MFVAHARTKFNLDKYDMLKTPISIEKLLQTPVCMMSGEEFVFLMNNLNHFKGESQPVSLPANKKLAYGIKGIAETFGCSIPTANRIKKSGVIGKAISQVGRKIVLDVDLALQLASENGGVQGLLK